MRINFLILFFFFTTWCSGLAGQDSSAGQDSMNITDVNGLRQGTWRTYFPEGTLEHETVYKDGKKNGLELSFFRWPNCIKEEIQYRNDSIDGYRIAYYRSCRIKLIETFQNGTLDGYVKQYRTNGHLSAEGLYKGGKLQGTVKKYSRSGEYNSRTSAKNSRARNVDLEGYLTSEPPLTDSAILKSLSILPQTGQTIIVTDVTGSMYNYVGQLLLWYKLNVEAFPARQFVFFNDGDERNDHTKRVGSTGGIYSCKTSRLPELKKIMELSINKGSGGDMQENDLEAVLAGIKEFRHVDQVILIADRMSPVRDYSLLTKIKVPVHVILCGTPEYTNPQYLDIAWRTGGKVYSLNEELMDVRTIREGEKLQIADLTYVFHSGRFRRVRD
jgi:hypothetical protein